MVRKKERLNFLCLSEKERTIVKSIIYVDQVISFDDDAKGSCINALEKVKLLYPNDEIYFANGGDRNKKNIPEMKVSDINFIFSVGGDDKKKFIHHGF